MTGFDVTSKVPTILSTLFFHFCKVQVPSQFDFVIKLKISKSMECTLRDPRKLLHIVSVTNVK